MAAGAVRRTGRVVPDRHKTTPKAVRMPDGLEARVETAAEADGASVNGFIVAAIEEKLRRRGSGSTAPAAPVKRGSTTRKPREAPAPAARFVAAEKPESATCPHPKARINKGLCGACGTYVGTSGGK